jgi:hypothetical protein
MGTAGTAERTHAPHKRAGLLYPMMLIAAISVIVLSVVGIATMMGWMPGALSGHDASGRAAGVPLANPGADRYLLTCDDCGTIEAVRPIELGRGREPAAAGAPGSRPGKEIERSAKPAVIYRITVRMNDGTTRTFIEPAKPALGVGQKVRVSERGIVSGG